MVHRRRQARAHQASASVEMDGMTPSDISSGCRSTAIISRASLTMCEYSTRISVSVGDAFRRSISTLKNRMFQLARTFQRAPHVQPTRLEREPTIINEANVAGERKIDHQSGG